MITQTWAHSYCDKLMAQLKIDFPFTISRMKPGGYEDASAHITNEQAFFEAYQLFDTHPRCKAILLHHPKLSKPVSI